MYKIFAIIVFSINGNPMGEPAKITNKLTFASEAECRSFQSSEKNLAAIEILKETVVKAVQPNVDIVIGTACELAKDDGSI